MKIAFSTLLFIIFSNFITAQDILLQGWYWDYPKTAQGASWPDTLMNKAEDLSSAGFTQVWLPPLSLAGSGGGSNGYDIRDYFYLGNTPGVRTGFGTRAKVDAVINKFNQVGMIAIADMIYNHRDGGQPERNDAVAGWIKNYNNTKYLAGDKPYPSDRVKMTLPIGGTTGRGSGKYYFKIRSASQNPDFYGKGYTFFVRTNRVGNSGLPAKNESTGANGGGDCGQPHDTIELARTMNASIDVGGCGIDEFMVSLDTNDYNASGDQLTISIINTNSDYADQYILGLWYTRTNSNLRDSLIYTTNTSFQNLPSGRGQMNFLNFKPNGAPTCLCGDSDVMLFFYDVDQNRAESRDTLRAYTKWMWDNVGVRGFRVDAIKNMPPSFSSGLLNYLNSTGINPPLYVGEHYSYSDGELKTYIDNVKSGMTPSALANINPRLFDFGLQEALRDACDALGFDARNIFQRGIVDGAGGIGFDVVTIVNNHDFRNTGNAVDNDAILAYAYLIMNNKVGLPSVYYPDYYNPLYTSRLKAVMQAHKKFVAGSSNHEYLNRFGTPFSGNFISGASSNATIFQLGGANGCNGNGASVAAINFSGNTLKVDQTINTGGGFNISPGDTLIDVLGYSNFDYAVVDANNKIYIELPGRSFSLWAKVPFPVAATITTSSTSICFGDTSILNSNITLDCYTYQWFRNSIPIPGANQSQYKATLDGTYSFEISYNGNLPAYSNSVSVAVLPGIPLINFSNNAISGNLSGSYTWYYSSDSSSFTILSGITDSTLTPLVGGYYYASVASQGCIVQTNVINVLLTGINNPLAFGISVFPNPANESITINSLHEMIEQVLISNPLGQFIKTSNGGRHQHTISTTDISSGVYTVTIFTTKGTLHQNVLIQH
ncbi:MAG: hypothetical protein RIQ89_385 [Bacteroidota bacterium]